MSWESDERDHAEKRCVELEAKLADALAGICQQVIPHTFVACGEGGNYCSEACRLRADLAEAEAASRAVRFEMSTLEHAFSTLEDDESATRAKLAAMAAARDEACDVAVNFIFRLSGPSSTLFPKDGANEARDRIDALRSVGKEPK